MRSGYTREPQTYAVTWKSGTWNSGTTHVYWSIPEQPAGLATGHAEKERSEDAHRDQVQQRRLRCLEGVHHKHRENEAQDVGHNCRREVEARALLETASVMKETE